MKTKRALLWLSASVLVAGCSLFLDLAPEQCAVDGDCARRGGLLAARVCVAGTCVAPTGDLNDADGPPVTDPDAALGGCVSNAQCSAENLDQPYVCRQPNRGLPCVRVKSDECPLVLGDKKVFTDPNVIFIGAYAPMNGNPLEDQMVLNYDFAAKEFAAAKGGVTVTPGVTSPLAMVVCRNNPAASIVKSAEHMVKDVGVMGIISVMHPDSLKEMYEKVALPNNTFVLNALDADVSVTQGTNGLMWHLLGEPQDYAPPFNPLVTRVETHLSTTGVATVTRLAIVSSDSLYNRLLSDAVTKVVRINGGKTPAEAGTNFLPIQVASLAASPDATYVTEAQRIIDFRPTIIVSLTGKEFSRKLLPAIEAGWVDPSAGGTPRPFYVLSPQNVDPDIFAALASAPGGTEPDRRKRFVGVNVASAEDLSLYRDYIQKLRAATPGATVLEGYENFYDAVYTVAYALAATRGSDTSGTSIGKGMLRLLDGPRFDIGVGSITRVLSALAVPRDHLSFFGTLGPPTYDPSAGVRRGIGSVYCLPSAGSQFLFDVLRYANGSLSGTFPTACIPGF